MGRQSDRWKARLRSGSFGSSLFLNEDVTVFLWHPDVGNYEIGFLLADATQGFGCG
jgi:hypothetical protein